MLYLKIIFFELASLVHFFAKLNLSIYLSINYLTLQYG